MLRAARLLALLVAVVLAPARAGAAGDFGPSYLVERIAVRGNHQTAAGVIERQLLIHRGDVVSADDPRVDISRFRVLALGFFTDVQITLERGSERGRALLVVDVVERGTVILNQLFFGGSDAVPLWGGLDVSENNFGGRGVGVGAAWVVTMRGDVPGARPQRAFRLRLADSRMFGTAFSFAATALYNEASEPYRTAGADGDGRVGNFTAVNYRRYGGLAGLGIEAGHYARIAADYRLERVEAAVPDALVRTLPDGRTTSVNTGLRNGGSWDSTLTLTFERDTRSDPILPTRGSRVLVVGELGSPLLGSTYEFYKLSVHYQGWFALPWGHALSAHGFVGAIVGDAPIFDRYYVGDLDPNVPPRALGLTLSTQPARNLLGTTVTRDRFGTLAARLGVEYLWPLFRGGRYFYGGHLFAGAGVFALGTVDDALARDAAPGQIPVPFDLYFDGGLRLDTYVGIFNFSIANFLGRLPF